MRYIVGDIHANIRELENLLRLLHIAPADELIFLGDYIDKLPYTQQTLALLTALQSECNCIFLKGNHEYVWDQYVNERKIERQSFLLQFGGAETLREYRPEAQQALLQNDLQTLREVLDPYFLLISQMKDWRSVDGYLALHAGLLEEQYEQSPLVFREANYFVRPERIPFEKKYLDCDVLVAGHTHLSDEPTIKRGYINIDLGAGYGKFLGAFSTEEHCIIRSDGKTFPLAA